MSCALPSVDQTPVPNIIRVNPVGREGSGPGQDAAVAAGPLGSPRRPDVSDTDDMYI